jgi:hypothetical protein
MRYNDCKLGRRQQLHTGIRQLFLFDPLKKGEIMRINRNRVCFFLAASLVAIMLSGCAGAVKNMRTVPPDQAVASPVQGKAMVVFMRPATLGFAIQSSVFEVKQDEPMLIGIVAAKKKVAYQVDPGKHLFMVVGESADFMSAQLDANKTYYTLVTPRMGMWKARFSLKPVSAAELQSPDFNKWYDACEWVEKIPAADTWAADNMTSIKSKQDAYYTKWMNKDSTARPMLHPEDGR